MQRSLKWQVLQHETEHLPLLAISASFDRSGYTIQITDLNAVWEETLDRQGLCRRANTLRSSIDPGENDRQYDTVIRLLHEVLLHEQESTIELSSGRHDQLVLKLERSLPRPLAPLIWEATLHRAHGTQLRDELLAPLLRQVHALQQHKEALFAELVAKDHVITRLADRLEASGMPMSDIFPNLRGAISSREKAAQRVHGLGTFDPIGWQKQHVVSDDKVLDVHLLDGVLQRLPMVPYVETEAQSPKWWTNFELKLSSGVQDSVNIRSEVLPSQPSIDRQDTEASTFQRQPRPATVSSKNGHDHELSNAAELNAGDKLQHSAEDDTDGPEDHAPPETKTTTIRKLGTIGGVKKAPPQAEIVPEQADLAARPKTKPKLGSIGGKKQTAIQEQREADHSQSSRTLSSDDADSPSLRKKNELINDGDEAKAAKFTESHKQNALQVRAAKATATAPELQGEDEPKRDPADSKRAELKRQLEQSKPIAKKKRKF